jgi:hypothetical protein
MHLTTSEKLETFTWETFEWSRVFNNLSIESLTNIFDFTLTQH